MVKLLKPLRSQKTFIAELPAMAIAWLLAEFFYKFHSFSLECAAFLAPWLILNAGVSFVADSVRHPGDLPVSVLNEEPCVIPAHGTPLTAEEMARAKVWYNVEITRKYYDGERWQDATSFLRDDLPLVGKLSDLAYDWIWSQKARPNTGETEL